MSPRIGRPYHLGIPCHVIGRGCNKQAIFLDDQDNRYFIMLMGRVAEETETTILGFCLMCNHFHLLARRHVGPLSGFFQPLLTSYGMYFNRKYGRVGHVFQNRPLLKRCLDDQYLKTVLRYIHLNPVKAGLVGSAGDWVWSSQRTYLAAGRGLKGGYQFVDTRPLLDLFGSGRAYEDFMGEAALDQLPDAGQFLPSEEDALQVEVEERISLETLAVSAAQSAQIEMGRLIESRDHSASRARVAVVALALAKGYTRAEIARFLGCSKSAISMMLRRRDVNL